MTKKKIGILAQYLDTRHDIRLFIEALSNRYDIVIYLKENEIKWQDYFQEANISYKIIESTGSNSYLFKIIKIIYGLFGYIPRSKNNFYITERFKFEGIQNEFIKRFNLALLNITMVLPKFISYDFYLKLILAFKKKIDTNGIDEFLCFTQIYDDLTFGKIIGTGLPVKVYVYSWDHPCKMRTFSKHIKQYLVWNEGIKEDLVKLQGIEKDKIRVYGATQLCYLKENFPNLIRSSKFNYSYVYFLCATGYTKIAEQEILLINRIANCLFLNFPELKLLVRPYPFLKENGYYRDLLKSSNVIIEEIPKNIDPFSYQINGSTKMTTLINAKMVLHVGTTLGIEASYLNNNVFLMDCVQEFNDLNAFVHQYQNDKYLNTTSSNVIRNFDSLVSIVHSLSEDKNLDNLLVPFFDHTAVYTMEELVNQY